MVRSLPQFLPRAQSVGIFYRDLNTPILNEI